MKHLKPLTSLRFFAAFVVVLCHIRYPFDPFKAGDHLRLPVWAWNFAKNGFVGVNLFFVLSGFVIAYNYGDKFLEKTTTFLRFMIARFARIWPAFVTALILAFPVYVLRGDDKTAMAKFPLMLPVHLLLIHNWFPNLGASWLSPSWTIGTEWGFYLMFPLFAAAVFKLREKGLWTLLIVSAALTFIAPIIYHSGALSQYSQPDTGGEDFWGRVLRWYSFVRLPEFLVGVAVCRLYMLQTLEQREKWSRVMAPLALLGLAFIVWVMAADPFEFMFTNQAVLTLPFAAIIWYLAYDRGWISKALALPTLILLGEASYSLYLIHIVVKQYFYRIGGIFFLTRADSIPLALSIIVGSIFASIIIFKKIEKPARRWIVKRFAGKATSPAPALQEQVEPEPITASAGRP